MRTRRSIHSSSHHRKVDSVQIGYCSSKPQKATPNLAFYLRDFNQSQHVAGMIEVLLMKIVILCLS